MTGAYIAVPHRHLGTCADCYVWWGPRGSAHDPWRCPFLRDAIARQERQIQDGQRRLDSLRQTLASGDSQKRVD